MKPFSLAWFASLVVAALLGAGAFALLQPLVVPSAAPGSASVREAILADPAIIPDAMEALRSRETGKVIAANRSAIVDPFGNAWKGDPAGDVTVVAYMDYACGYCRASLPILDQLVAADADVKIVFRELPILSEASRRAAQWSLAAAEQGKFRQYHDILFTAGQLSDATIDAAIARAGLDRVRGERVVRSEAVQAEIQRNLALAGQLGMTGTPAWVVGDRVLSGALPLQAMQSAVASARSAG
ncbi:DsbA family protein [Sphingomonas japonica]|uniref:Protein-disulfide isomerase n=1 Tax=Sphingomonas japonica TaxID=511662 RepID=A0ABX0U1T2_9SPHN|nr:DsbA family protein [Sphingomonas japonica]NIJ24040.1 protein-disulfide isomerase [Sphingomonas japonica]